MNKGKLFLCHMNILGTQVDNITFDSALQEAEKFLFDGKQHYIVTPNPEIILKARKDSRFRSILNKADLRLPDGTGLLWASKKLYGKKKRIAQRVTGIDFMEGFLKTIHLNSTVEKFCVSSSCESYAKYRRAPRVLLIGGLGSVASKAAHQLQKKFPNIDFYSIENFESKHIDFIIGQLILPDIIFVALGAPKQEFWLYESLSNFPKTKIIMGVGGAFDILSGRIIRAPIVLQRYGFEWLWRLLQEPMRVKRIFRAVVLFPFLVFRHRKVLP
jgi:N-acetylglucosaminyldiphosphoundecaprenol N-acetyl-beta-D-mannosaminyltransferase